MPFSGQGPYCDPYVVYHCCVFSVSLQSSKFLNLCTFMALTREVALLTSGSDTLTGLSPHGVPLGLSPPPPLEDACSALPYVTVLGFLFEKAWGAGLRWNRIMGRSRHRVAFPKLCAVEPLFRLVLVDVVQNPERACAQVGPAEAQQTAFPAVRTPGAPAWTAVKTVAGDSPEEVRHAARPACWPVAPRGSLVARGPSPEKCRHCGFPRGSPGTGLAFSLQDR